MLSYMGESLQDEKGSKGTDTHTQNGLFSITNVQFLSLFFWGFQKTRKKKSGFGWTLKTGQKLSIYTGI